MKKVIENQNGGAHHSSLRILYVADLRIRIHDTPRNFESDSSFFIAAIGEHEYEIRTVVELYLFRSHLSDRHAQ